MKISIVTKIFLCLVLICFSEKAFSQTGVALIVSNKETLTLREQAVKDLLTNNGYNVAFKNYSEANFDNLKDFLFVVAADDGALSSDTIYLLVFGGKKIILLHTAAKPLGGDWSYGGGDESSHLYVESKEAFLQDYVRGSYFLVQQSNYAWYIYSNYPSGWKIIGRDYWENEKTALYRTHTSGGKGVILTYDPLYFTDGFGKDLFKRIIGFVTDVQVVEPVDVPDGNIAFVIAGYDDQTPTLSEREENVKFKLWELGYTGKITYISTTRVWPSDLSRAGFVIATENSVIDDDLVYSQIIQQGGKVVLLYDAAKPLGGNWSYNSGDKSRHLYVESKEAFLQDYVKGSYFLAQQSNYAWYIDSNYPSGWKIIGRDYWENEKTALYRTHTSGGKGAIFTYDPRYFTLTGDTVFQKIVDPLKGWLTPVEKEEKITVPEIFTLSQNYPNPFNPTTMIRFDLPKRSLVTLKVYDVVGREVATLVNEDLQCGEYNIVFDAKCLASGVYFYHLVTDGYVKSKKILLLR